eukprot:CAMPEP_0178953028 /NCGR_PEP_ID=MMETSP0789-20121207/8185_1 /TAXON_ID=3005 /ORGANISM="Rhizosolenia setigera, Strain CCMP 1694" /LENGTH=865 /DNA_ID=CAMNT_0020634229 /DNA_START=36 /DNA_END=2633 /DNA_ORIENTATION=-
MADLSSTLLACQSPDPNIRKQAEQYLVQAEQSNLPSFFQALATELSTEGKDVSVRQLAGLHLKNLLFAKDNLTLEVNINRWKAMPADQRTPVKNLLLQSLRSSESIARHTAAQAAAEVASIELPFSEWPEFAPALTELVTSAESPDGVKVTALETLGFACERLGVTSGELSQDITDKMLTLIVDGLQNERPNEIRKAAAVALRNSLVFTSGNMENVNERNMIMQAVCETTRCSDSSVRAAAYECIVNIAYQYYNKLRDYMPTLFQITLETIKSDEEPVALQALEFWSTVAEEEFELLDEAADYQSRGEPIPEDRQCMRYIAGALEHLIPIFTEVMAKQDEEADEDTWNLSMAAGTCMTIVAGTVEDLIVPAIMPFVQANIKSDNWRLREAATMAFSTILDGPSTETIGPYVNQSIPVLLEALKDAHPMVKDSSAWTIGRICDIHVRSIPSETFPALVTALSGILITESPRVSAQACYALHNLAAAFEGDDAAASSGTNALSPYMASLLQTLLQVADRENSDECNLRLTAFEAVVVLIQHSAPDCKPILLQLLPVMIERLSNSFSIPALTNEDREIKEGLQGLLCGVIQIILIKMTKEEVIPYGDSVMQGYLQVLQVKNATAHEEALLAVGALADILGPDFEKYMSALQPFLMVGLKNFESYQVCRVAVGVVGDICRAIEGKIQPYCDEIMSALLQSLQNPTLHRSVKPPVLSCFGDIALAIAGAYEPYLQVSLMMLFQAGQTQAPPDDEELVDYVFQLREGILEAYTGILQGLKDGGRSEVMLPYIENVLVFLEMLTTDPDMDESVMGKAIGCVGDVASTLGPRVAEGLAKPWVQQLFQMGQSTPDDGIIQTTSWARSQVQAILK